MKKCRLLILISVLILAVLGTVASFAALSATAKISGPSAVRENDTFVLEFKVTCDEIYGMEANLSETGPITRESIKLNPELTGWTIESQNGVFMVYSNDLSKSFSGDNTTLFSITYKVQDTAAIGDNLSVKFSDVVLANHLTSDQTNPFSVSYSKSIEKKLSTNTNLLSLKIDGKAVDGFDYTKTEYQMTVPFETESVSVSAVCAGEGATYTVAGNTALKVGTNNVVVKVTAASGATKDYTVKVTRGNPPDLAILSGLSAGSYTLSPAFDPAVFAYTVTVPYTKTSISLTPSAASGVRYTVSGGDKLAVGDNTVTVKVTDQYDNTNTYTVTVTRRQNSNTNLLKLAVDGYALTPEFNYSVTDYSLKVDNNVTSLKVNAIVAGDGATVAVTGNELDESGGTIIVTVTAMDKTTKEYKIKVTKEGNKPVDPPVNPPVENAALLKGLSVKNAVLSPSFSASINAYTLTVANSVTSLEVIANGENGSEVIVSGADDLKVGENRVTILVKASGKADTEYVLTVTRLEAEPSPDSAKLQSVTLSAGMLSPVFHPDTFSYIVYLPYETSSLNVSAVSGESASIEGIGDYTLSPGSNTVTLQVSSPEGKATYTIIAYVMPAFDGSLPSLGENNATNGILSIIGNNSVGGKLTASFGGAAGVVRWFRDGTAVGGSADYIVTADDIGKVLTVIVYDESGNALATKDIAISANASSIDQKNSGFDITGMVISLIAALATLIIGFILGKMSRAKNK